MKLFLAVLTLALTAASAQARLGDTMAQCSARYGKPVSSTATGAMVYLNNGWYITVSFTNGTAAGERYVKVDRHEIGLDELTTLLKFEGGSQRWSAPVADGAGGVELSCGQLASSLSKDRLSLLVGTRDCVEIEKASARPAVTPAPLAENPGELLTTVSGKTYKGARFNRATPDGIVIVFAGGVIMVPLNELPEAWQAKYKDAVAAATPEPTPVEDPASSPTGDQSVASSSGSGGGGSGGSVYVHGYTRKDGTYVHSYTRGGRR